MEIPAKDPVVHCPVYSTFRPHDCLESTAAQSSELDQLHCVESQPESSLPVILAEYCFPLIAAIFFSYHPL